MVIIGRLALTYLGHSSRLTSRHFASQVPKPPSFASPSSASSSSADLSRPKLMKKLTDSPAILKATSDLLKALELKGLSTDHEPSSDEWARMMADDEIQEAIREVGRRCDEEGVPINENVIETLKRENDS